MKQVWPLIAGQCLFAASLYVITWDERAGAAALVFSIVALVIGYFWGRQAAMEEE